MLVYKVAKVIMSDFNEISLYHVAIHIFLQYFECIVRRRIHCLCYLPSDCHQ